MHYDGKRLTSGTPSHYLMCEGEVGRHTEELSARVPNISHKAHAISPIFDPCRTAISIAMTSRCLQTCHAKRRVRDLAQT